MHYMRDLLGWLTYIERSRVPSSFSISLNGTLSSNKSSEFSIATDAFATNKAFPGNGMDNENKVSRAPCLESLSAHGEGKLRQKQPEEYLYMLYAKNKVITFIVNPVSLQNLGGLITRFDTN